jgi:hypothetical protein
LLATANAALNVELAMSGPNEVTEKDLDQGESREERSLTGVEGEAGWRRSKEAIFRQQ